MSSPDECQFPACTAPHTQRRTVANNFGSAFTVAVCENHAKWLDKGGEMLLPHKVVPHKELPR